MKQTNKVDDQPRNSTATEKGLFTFYKEQQQLNQMLKAQDKLKKKVKSLKSHQNSSRSHKQEVSLSKRSKNSKNSSKKSFESSKKSKKKIKNRHVTQGEEKKMMSIRKITLTQEKQDSQEIDIKQKFLKNILNRKIHRSNFCSSKIQHQKHTPEKQSISNTEKSIPQQLEGYPSKSDISYSQIISPLQNQHYSIKNTVQIDHNHNKMNFYAHQRVNQQFPSLENKKSQIKKKKNKTTRIDTQPSSISLLRKRYQQMEQQKMNKNVESISPEKQKGVCIKKKNSKKHNFQRISSVKNQQLNQEMLDDFIKVKAHFYERQKKLKEKKRYTDNSLDSQHPINLSDHKNRKNSNTNIPSNSLKFPQIKPNKLSKALKNIMEIANTQSIPPYKYDSSKPKKVSSKKLQQKQKSEKKYVSHVFCHNFNFNQSQIRVNKLQETSVAQNESHSISIINRSCESRISVKMAKIDLSRVEESPKYQKWSIQKRKALKKLGLKIQQDKIK